MKEKFKVKTKIKATDRSQLTGDTISEVIQSKLNFLVDRVQNEPPHILWISKYAFMWSGAGKLFGMLNEDNPIRKQFLTTFKEKGHLSIKRPTNKDLQVMEYKYGLALSFPPESLFSLIQTGFRKMEKQINKLSDMAMMPCTGYINEEGKVIQPNGFVDSFNESAISGYFIFCIDDKRIKTVQKQLIDDSDLIFQLQFERAKYTQARITDRRIRTGEAIQGNAINSHTRIMPYLEKLNTNHPVLDWNPLLDKAKSDELDQ